MLSAKRLLILCAASGLPRAAAADDLPQVLILGDSISMGYTPFVVEQMKEEAEVSRPKENCAGTLKGVERIDAWLGDTDWDVIHFNWGLHDLKRVKEDGQNSDNPDDPRQSEPGAYQEQLLYLVERMKETGATLVFATTTDFPDLPDGPVRHAADAVKYNAIALGIMNEHGVAINDLYGFTKPRLADLQKPNNVHFTETGSQALAEQVADAIRGALHQRAAHQKADTEG